MSCNSIWSRKASRASTNSCLSIYFPKRLTQSHSRARRNGQRFPSAQIPGRRAPVVTTSRRFARDTAAVAMRSSGPSRLRLMKLRKLVRRCAKLLPNSKSLDNVRLLKSGQDARAPPTRMSALQRYVIDDYKHRVPSARRSHLSTASRVRCSSTNQING